MASSLIHTYSDDDRVWNVENLWKQSKKLPIKKVFPADVIDLNKVSMDIWWDKIPSGKIFLSDLEAIMKSNLRYPIILSAEGDVMDGMHRLFKAIILRKPILVRQFKVTPEPDYYDFELDS